MADETTDIINKKQFVICIRWVDNDLNANEDFIGLPELSATNAETLTFILKDVVLNVFEDNVMTVEHYDEQNVWSSNYNKKWIRQKYFSHALSWTRINSSL